MSPTMKKMKKLKLGLPLFSKVYVIDIMNKILSKVTQRHSFDDLASKSNFNSIIL